MGERCEIIEGRRGRHSPVERRSLPWIAPEVPPVTELRDDIDQHKSKADCHDRSAGRGNEIVDFPTGLCRIGMDTAWHAEKTGEMHHEECCVEADEDQPEGRLRQMMHRETA